MRLWQIEQFGLDNLRLIDAPSPPPPGPGQVVLRVQALSLNYRDLLVVRGQYNPKFRLPATPLSDAAGMIDSVGPGVADVQPGQLVSTHFVSGWLDGPFRGEYLATSLGLPGAGVAAEYVTLPAHAVIPAPRGYDAPEAATLPIAALTAWSALVTEGRVHEAAAGPRPTVLTLGTGGVSIFALQIAKALGAAVIVTSKDDAKLERAKSLGADHVINYERDPDWEKRALEITGGTGADVVVETVGAATLDRSLRATKAGGTVALLGAIAGMKAEVTVGTILMKRLRIAGILVDSRAAFERMNRFIERHDVRPVIDRRFSFTELPQALRRMEAGQHLGKLVLTP